LILHLNYHLIDQFDLIFYIWDFGYVNTRLGELDLYMKA
jgi:hypothetical protein